MPPNYVVCFSQAKNTFEKTLNTMIKEPNMLVDQTHSLGAVLKGAILLIFFVFGVEVYAQSYNLSESYRVSGTTQSTPSVSQGGGYGVSMAGKQVMYQGGAETREYKMYQGTVYEPFNNTLPSENGNGSQISGRKNAWGGGGMGDQDGDDPGHRDTNSPVGEPWILLFFAAVAAVFVAIRKKEPTPALPQGKE